MMERRTVLTNSGGISHNIYMENKWAASLKHDRFSWVGVSRGKSTGSDAFKITSRPNSSLSGPNSGRTEEYSASGKERGGFYNKA